jgi:hypothetical protein
MKNSLFFAVEALEREVNNGGYDQFFSNPSNEYVPFIVDALSRIGCSETADLTQRAIEALGIEGDITVDEIENVMEEEDGERDEILSECDDQYYEYSGDLANPLLEFIKNNKEKIDIGS